MGKAEDVTVLEATKIAEIDPRTTYFFYMKGSQMIVENLETEPETCRVFQTGDAVFFSSEPSLVGFRHGFSRWLRQAVEKP